MLREQAGLLVGSLARRYGDLDLAEEAVQSAVLDAVTRWRAEGPPARPGAWLQVTAQRRAVDAVRRAQRRRALARQEAPPPADPPADEATDDGTDDGTDDRIALLFACCHPALAPEARLALTLRAVVGLTTPQIARAFLVPEATLAQRIVRAKRKIVTAGIPLAVPEPARRRERLRDVLAVVYVMFNEGFVSTTGATQDRDLAGDAVWLAEVVATGLPDQAEAWGLAALLRVQHARAAARFTPDGELVLLRDQDRRRWDHASLAAGEAHLERAAALNDPGPYQLQAAIAACHAAGRTWEETDWLQIIALYDLLLAYDPSPVTRLNRVVARIELEPAYAARALADLDELVPELDGYHLFHATRGEILTRLGREAPAAEAHRRALELTGNEAERRLLVTRLHRHPLTDGS